MHLHKERSKTDIKRKIYQQFTFDKFCNKEIKMIVLEEISLENKNQLHKLEDEYIRKELNNNLCLNTIGALKNRELQKQHNKQYRDENKEYITQMRKQYREKTENKEHKKEYDK